MDFSPRALVVFRLAVGQLEVELARLCLPVMSPPMPGLRDAWRRGEEAALRRVAELHRSGLCTSEEADDVSRSIQRLAEAGLAVRAFSLAGVLRARAADELPPQAAQG